MKSYEPNRNLLTSVDNRANGVTVSRFDYVNDALGRRTQRIDTGSASATNAFAYNPKSDIGADRGVMRGLRTQPGYAAS